jgi:putative tricarboxylic transport membrane protein
MRDGHVTLLSHGPSGSGPSRLLNGLAQALLEASLVSEAVVLDRPGKDGAEAIQMLAQRPGDSLLAASCTPTYLTTPIKQRLSVTHRDFTPLGRLVADTYLVVTSSDNSATSGSELFRLPTRCAIGIRGGNTHIHAMLVAKTTRRPIALHFCDGIGDAIHAVLVGEADWTTGVSTDFATDVHAGRLKIIASLAAADEPSPGVGRLVDTGVGVSFALWRGLIGPGQLDSATIQRWEAWVRAIRLTAAWKAYLANDGVRDAPSSADEFGALLDAELPRYANWLRAVAPNAG